MMKRLLALCLLASPLTATTFYPDDYGAKCVGLDSDAVVDTTGVQAAVDAASAVSGRVEIHGNCVIREAHPRSGIDVRSNVTIAGPGGIKVQGGVVTTGDFHAFLVRDVENVTFENLTLDGNKGGILGANEQTHLVQVEGGRNVSFDHVDFLRPWGDGVKVLYGPFGDSKNIRVTNCTFLDSRRNGVTLQSGINGMVIAESHFAGISDQAIDFEPSSTPVRNVRILGNHLENVPQGADVLTLTNAYGLTVSGNTILGPVQSYDGRQVTFYGNVINSPHIGKPALKIIKNADGWLIQNNSIQSPHGGVTLGAHGTGTPKRIIVTGNEILALSCVSASSVENLTVSHNVCRYSGTPGQGTGILARQIIAPLRAAIFTGNQLYDFATGIRPYADKMDVENVLVSGNIIISPFGSIGVELGDGTPGNILNAIVTDNLCSPNLAGCQ